MVDILGPNNGGGRGPVPPGGYPLPYTSYTRDQKIKTVNEHSLTDGVWTIICKIRKIRNVI